MKPQPAPIDVLAPADSFRLLLAARYGKDSLKFADKIESYHWFYYWKSLGTPASVYHSADRAIKRLCKHIKDGEIRLRGELATKDPPCDIDRADCLVGELHVFEQTLTIYAHGLTPARIYRRVYCVKSDVARIANDISKERLGQRAINKLKQPSDSTIRNEIKSVYDDADKGAARPNINELPDVVLPRLAKRGFITSVRRIRDIGREDQFKSRRGPRGKHRKG
jgi:hypothetical protein